MLHLTPAEIDLWLEQALPEERLGHLEACGRCTWEAHETLALTRALAALPALDPPPQLAERVLAGLRSPARAPQRAPTRRRVPIRRRAWALAASVAGLSVLSSGLIAFWALANPAAVAAAMAAAQGSLAALLDSLRTAVTSQLALIPWRDLGNALIAQRGQLAGLALFAAVSYVTLLITLWNLMRPPRRSYAPPA